MVVIAMKVLFVTSGAIACNVSSGNTFLNLFGELADTELYSLFTRSEVPDKKIKAAFRIAEAELPRYIFRRDRIGERVTANDQVLDEHAMQLEAVAKRNVSQIKYIARDILWKIAPWKNRNLRTFIEEVQPDLIVSILNENLSLGAMTAFAQKHSGAPLMLFAWDDNYSYTVGWSAPLTRLSQTVHRRYMRKIAKRADTLFVISEKQKADYERIFGRSCEIMTKGADFSERPMPTPHHEPLRLLYAGNLALGRWETLAAVKEALQHINKNGMRAVLHIYSATLLSDAQRTPLRTAKTPCSWALRQLRRLKRCKRMRTFWCMRRALTRNIISLFITLFRQSSLTVFTAPNVFLPSDPKKRLQLTAL